MILYDPRGMTWPQYSALMSEQLSALGIQPMPEDRWKDWVRVLINQGYLQRESIPDPGTFTSWQNWAQRIMDVLTSRR